MFRIIKNSTSINLNWWYYIREEWTIIILNNQITITNKIKISFAIVYYKTLASKEQNKWILEQTHVLECRST